MYKLIFILFLIPQSAIAQFYVEIGMGMTDEISSQPEINLINPLGKISVGYQAEYNWSVSFEHISSIQMHEEGSGLNTFWVNKRIWIH